MSVIDTATDAVGATVAVGEAPGDVAVALDGSRIYVGNFDNGTISVIDTGTNTVVATLAAPNLVSIALSPDGTRLYATNFSADALTVIDTVTHAVVATVGVGDSPFKIVGATTPAGMRVYVTHLVDAFVTVIDAATNTVVTTVTVDHPGTYAAVTPDGTRAYVATPGFFDDHSVSVIDTVTNTWIDTVDLSEGVGDAFHPWGVAITPDGRRAYVTHRIITGSPGVVSVIETVTNTVADEVTVGEVPSGVAITPDGSRAYVTNADSDTVSVIEIPTNIVVATVPVGVSPFGIAITPGSTTAEDVEDTIEKVVSFNLPAGLSNALKAKLQKALDAIEQGDFATACSELQAFENQVMAQSGKKMTPAQAAELLDAVDQLQAQLGCA